MDESVTRDPEWMIGRMEERAGPMKIRKLPAISVESADSWI